MTDEMEELQPPFEDPAKSAMRGRCKTAIEASAYLLIDRPRTFPAPKTVAVFGGVRGDLQSRTRDHKKTHAYYLRPGRLKVAPKWLVNLGEVSRHMSGVEVFLVVEESNHVLLESCRSAGVGLLRLTSTDEFVPLAMPFERQLVEASKDLQSTLNSARRTLEMKLDRQLTIFATQFGELAELTRGMGDTQQARYASDLERKERTWRGWAESVSAMLDEAAMTKSASDLKAIVELIEEGPEL